MDHETDDHLYQCPHVLRRYWRQTLTVAIDEAFGSFLDSDLMAIIHLGLQSFYDDGSPNFTERFPDGYSSTPYAFLIEEQSRIGWDHFIRGKLSGEWIRLQYQHAARFNLLKESENWTVKLIKLFAHSSFQLWDIHNGCRHGNDPVSKAQAALDQAHRKICTLYHLFGMKCSLRIAICFVPMLIYI